MSMSHVTEGCSEKYGKRLIGKTDMEDALKNLDRLTQEEARMTIAENLRVTHAVDNKVAGVIRGVYINFRRSQYVFDLNFSDVKQVERSSSPSIIDLGYGALYIISGNQLRDSIYKWLSPTDSSTNHNIACDIHHKKTATWFFEGNIYKEWRSKGSLMWIHGKRAPCPNFLSETSR